VRARAPRRLGTAQASSSTAAAEGHEPASLHLLCSSQAPNPAVTSATAAPAAPRGAPATLQPPGRGCCNPAPQGHRRGTGTWGDMLQWDSTLDSQ